MKNLGVALGLVFLGHCTFAGIAINPDLSTTSAANTINIGHGIVSALYYSHIGVDDGAGNWIGIASVPCNPSLNPRCNNPSDPFTLSVSDSEPTSGAANFYVVAVTGVNLMRGPGLPISSYGAVLGQASYTKSNSWTKITIPSFEFFCAAFAMPNSAVDEHCNQKGGFPVELTAYIFADANGNGVYDKGESIWPLNLEIQSTIPQHSSVQKQMGLYDWETFPSKGEVQIRNPKNTQIGFRAARFYYVTGPDLYRSFDVNTFNKISGAHNPGIAGQKIPYKDVLLNFDGSFSTYSLTGFDEQKTYYFRAALIDGAGNIGYLTPPSDDDPANYQRSPLHKHAVKPEVID